MSEFYESALNAYLQGAGLDVSDRRTAVVAAKTAGLKPHYFKKTELLPRVRRVIGFLRGVDAGGFGTHPRCRRRGQKRRADGAAVCRGHGSARRSVP